MDIKKILVGLGYSPLDRQEKEAETWAQLFKGKIRGFHEYSEYMGSERVTRERKTLKMAKAISELWADNIINPETKIVIQDEIAQEWWDNLDEEQGITPDLNDLMELTFALSNGATVQNKTKNDYVHQQYVQNGSIYPLRVEHREIVAVAFASEMANGDTYIQIHDKVGDKYEIKNLFFNEKGDPIVKEGIEEEFTSEVKLFQLYKPAIVNNVTLGNPLGISIFANAIDELKAVDIAYDALDKEIRNGQMRMFVQGSLLYFDKGKQAMIFDKNQDAFYLLPEQEENGELLKVVAPTLRVEQLINNLEKQLNLLGSKCGLGDNAFHSKDGTIYTNTTQVVSTNSKFYKTRQKHATRIERSLIEMVKALYFLEFGKELTESIYVDFDDSIIHDKEAEKKQLMLELNAGVISPIQYIMDTRNITEEEATEFYNKQVQWMSQGEDVEEEGGEV